MPNRKDNEQELIHRIVVGDQKAMKTVFRTYYMRLFYFTLKVVGDEEEAQDLVHESLMNFWLNVSNKKIIPENIERYLFRMIRNRCVNVLKRRRLVESKEGEIQDIFAENAEDRLDEIRLREQLFYRIAQSFVHLTPAQNEVMTGIYIKGLTIRQLADQLNTSPNNIRNHKARAIERLRGLLDPELFILFIMGSKKISDFL